MQGPDHRFVSQISLLAPPWHKSPPEGESMRTYFSMEIMKTSQRHPNIGKSLGILTIPKSKINLALKMTMTTKSFRKPRPDGPFENTL